MDVSVPIRRILDLTMPQRALLVCGGRFHDFDFARSEILSLLGAHPDVRTRVFEDFREMSALAEANFLVTYTCDVRPTESEQEALADFVRKGGRWLALHGTNSILEFDKEGIVHCPKAAPLFSEVLGSRFLGHPPISAYRVDVSQPEHPLVVGIESFEVNDELYLCELSAEIDTLLETHFSGNISGFAHSDWSQVAPRPVMYLRNYGKGQVLYNTLGHCRGRYDMQPLILDYPQVERGAWEQPVYYELLRRGLIWAKGQL